MPSMRGHAGSLRAAGRIAARFARWEGRVGKDCEIDATVKERNEYWLSCGGLTLELNVGKSVFRWRDVQVIDVSPKELTIIARGEMEHG